MKPIHFEGVNAIYKAPPTWNEDRDGPCGDLPVRKEPGQLTSCYELSNDDINELIHGAKLFFTIYQDVQPVVGWEIR